MAWRYLHRSLEPVLNPAAAEFPALGSDRPPPVRQDYLAQASLRGDPRLVFQGNLCYHGIDEGTRLQEQKF